MVVISSAKDVDTTNALVLMFAWEWEEVRFARTIEGSLAVEYVYKSFAMLVGVPVAVAVAVGVAVGDTKVSEPLVVVRVMDPADVLVNTTPERMSGDVPSATVANWTVARMPVSLGPSATPVVVQLNVTEMAVVVGAEQFTVRPVEPRNVPLETLVKERTALSQVSVKS